MTTTARVVIALFVISIVGIAFMYGPPSRSQSVPAQLVPPPAALAGSDSNWSGDIAALRGNIQQDEAALAQLRIDYTNLQAFVQLKLGPIGSTTTPPPTGGTTPPATKPIPPAGPVIAIAAADQSLCQGAGASIVPVGTTGTTVAGPKVMLGITCYNVAFNGAPSGWTPASALSGQ